MKTIARQKLAGLCLLLSAAWLLVLPAGCLSRKPPAELDLEKVERLAKLPGLAESHDPALRGELARITAEGGTPEQLAERDAAEVERNNLASLEQIAEQLNAIVPTARIALVGQRLDQLYPPGPFQFDPLRYEQTWKIGRQFDRPLQAYTQLLATPGFRFRIDWRRGLLADLSFVEHARLAHRLHALLVAECLHEGRLAEINLHLRNMLRIDQLLADVAFVVPRLEAARLRYEALRVVEAVAQYPRCSRKQQEQLRQLVDEQLADWPADDQAWIGDRALGLHTYELVRSGHLMSVLTEDEIDKLKEAKQLEAFIRAVTSSVDQDERFYLEAMRRVIAACGQPFHERKAVFAELDRELQQLRDSPAYPLFAAKVLLPRLESGHRLQALDRARCEAWSLALAASLGEPKSAAPTNPVTGLPYVSQRTRTEIRVAEIDAPGGSEAVAIPSR